MHGECRDDVDEIVANEVRGNNGAVSAEFDAVSIAAHRTCAYI